MVFLNNYSSGLSLYYLTANVVTMLQQWVIKTFFIDEEKIHAKLQANKTKPKKKNRLMKQMEKIQEQQNLQQNRQMRRRSK
jgi:YidC/Oxa1 family membrane protein insertase